MRITKITISKENYLKAIAEAESEGEVVIAATLARWLHVSAPAVAMAVKRLKRDKLIKVNGAGEISLSSTGRDIAKRLLKRHHLIERMLTEIFGMEWYKVHDEAEQMEHAVSEDFERKLVRKLGGGEACPHGNMAGIDGPDARRKQGLRRLDELEPGGACEVVSIFERDRRLLEYLDGLRVRPGTLLKVLKQNYDSTLNLSVRGKRWNLGQAAAAKIWVRPRGRETRNKRI